MVQWVLRRFDADHTDESIRRLQVRHMDIQRKHRFVVYVATQPSASGRFWICTMIARPRAMSHEPWSPRFDAIQVKKNRTKKKEITVFTAMLDFPKMRRSVRFRITSVRFFRFSSMRQCHHHQHHHRKMTLIFDGVPVAVWSSEQSRSVEQMNNEDSIGNANTLWSYPRKLPTVWMSMCTRIISISLHHSAA